MPLAVASRQRILSSFVLMLLLVLNGCEKTSNEDFGASDPSARPTCENFVYQDDAQYYYDTHKAAQLAPDGSGVACPSLPRRPQSPPLGVERRVIGPDATIIDRMQRLMPESYDQLLGKLLSLKPAVAK